MRKFIIVSLCALAVLGCKKNDSRQSFDSVVVTGGYSELTSTHVKISARFNPLYYMEVEEYGVVISSSESDPDLQRRSDYRSVYDGDVVPEYTCEFSYLQPGTTYYYRAFIRYDYMLSYKTEYGEVKTFTTPNQ